MSTPNDHTATKGLRGWWQSPPRHGMARLLAPYEYRHLRFFGVTRMVGGSIAAVAGLICVSSRVYGWAVFFLIIGALNLGGGYWEVALARSAPTRT